MISLKDFLILTKFKLSFVVSLSLVFGFLLAKEKIDLTIIEPFIAVFLLALGVSCLNQVQEYKEDSLMSRTKNRPIAAKRISPKHGFYISTILILIATLFIYLSLGIKGIIIFALVILLYNGFYTFAKKTTIYAAVYGAVLGVIPPMIGWISANGDLKTLEFFSLGLFYFIWQIPHFWLLVLKYKKDYKKAKFPTMIDNFGVDGLERITFIWLLLTLIAGSFLLMVFSVNYLTVLISLAIVNFITLFFILKLINNHNYLHNFIAINCYMLFTMALLVLDKII